MLKQIATLLTAAVLSFGTSAVMAQASGPAAGKPAAGSPACEKQADDKKLHGAARNSFVKKCSAGGGGDANSACEAKAVDKNGKPLAGAAKSSFMKKCVSETK